ncbi:MAG: YtxH domain-containing protein [Gemmatimonadota bacterium]
MFDSSDTQHREGADRKAFGLGLLVGAMVGASAALLLAPASGEQTRRKIKRGARRLYVQSGELAGDLWEDADDRTRRLRKQAARKLKGGMKRGSKYAQGAVELVETGRRRLGWR